MQIIDGKITIPYPFNPGKENVVGYLPNDIINPHELSYSQISSAKKAILWLLSKAPHTIDEVAGHFALSPELVQFLITELIISGELKSETKVSVYRAGRQAPFEDPHDTIATYFAPVVREK